MLEHEEPYPLEGWSKVSTSLRSGVARAQSLYLWYRVGKTAREMSVEEHGKLITELDVLYGDDVPWYGFERMHPPTYLATAKSVNTWLTYRRGVKRQYLAL